MRKSIRKAILIGAPGGQDSGYLPGVEKDLRDFRDYLCSVRGGLWREDEILLLNNPSAHRALSVIQSAQAEYVLVYFSGHGYTDLATASRMLCFRNHGSVPDTALTQAVSPRLLLISDACRNYHGEAISGIPLPGPDYFDFTGATAEIRRLFNDAILASPHGRIIIHGTSESQYAMDSRSGGYFTQALLHVAGRMNVPTGKELVQVERVLWHVPSVLEEKGNDQIPEIINLSGRLTVPFAVAMPVHDHAPAPPVKKQLRTAASFGGGSDGLWAALGLVALGIYLSE